MMDKWKIMIVDDHPLVREGLRGLIEREPDLCVSGEASGIHEALAKLHHGQPDLVILDLALADGDGLELIERLHKDAPGLKILVVTMRDELLFAERVIRAGALGYVSKQAATDILIDALRKTLRGNFYVSAEMASRIFVGLGRRQVAEQSTLDRLSNRELQVLRLIGQGHSTAEIAEQLHLSIKTIETHRAKLKRKLDASSATELVRIAVQWELGRSV